MKKTVLLLTFVLTIGLINTANALPFVTLVDWNFDQDTNGTKYIAIADSFSYNHLLMLNPIGQSIDTATLSIRHKGNNDDSEVWLVKTSLNVQIGYLSNSEDNWKINVFPLGQDAISEIMNSTPWSLQVRLREKTDGLDSLWLDWSKVYGTYTPITNPIPEPGSLMLLGTGLIGLISYGKTKIGKRS